MEPAQDARRRKERLTIVLQALVIDMKRHGVSHASFNPGARNNTTEGAQLQSVFTPRYHYRTSYGIDHRIGLFMWSRYGVFTLRF